MRKIACLLVLLSFLKGQISAQSLPRQGATVPVVLTQELNSRKPSEPVIQIAEDLVDANNMVVVSKGTPVYFNYKIVKAKSVGRPGSIEVNFISTKSIHGTTIPLTGTMKMEGDNKKAKVLGIGLGLGLTIAPPMLLYLLKRGGDVIIPENAKSVIPRIGQNTFEQ
jgi:hypothetical protein